MKKSCVMVCALLLCASTAGADVISDWNREAGARIGAGARRGPSGSLDFAVVHLAMHDAVQAFERRYQPYCVAIPSPSGSPVAAASKAARDVLVGLFPLQTAAIDARVRQLQRHLHHPGIDGGRRPGARAPAPPRRSAFSTAGWTMTMTNATPLIRSSAGPALVSGARPLPSRRAMTAEFVATFTPFAMNAPDQFRMANPRPI